MQTKYDNVKTVIRLNAGNDMKGNPRRVYVAFDGCDIAGAWNEGYAGFNAVPQELRKLAMEAATLATTATERRELLAMFDKDGNRKI